MPLTFAPYLDQQAEWPREGRHIMAHFGAENVVVYQAFRPEIGRFAVEHQRFGGPFSMNRMSWIKPNFLWMMYRSGWGTKANQEVTLAITVRRAGFDAVLEQAVHSTFTAEVYGTEAKWKAAIGRSSVRLQWDPDHDPSGAPVARRAIQLGLRGDTLSTYADEWIVSIENLSPFVAEQRAALAAGGPKAIVTPVEGVYPVADAGVASRLGLSQA
jgi:hypothetical protein